MTITTQTTAMTQQQVKDFFNGVETNLVHASISLAYHVLHSSNISAFTDMNITAVKMIEPSLRKYVPVKWNKEELDGSEVVPAHWSLNKDRADSIREDLGLTRGQFTFTELVEAIEEKQELAKAEALEAEAEEARKLAELSDADKLVLAQSEWKKKGVKSATKSLDNIKKKAPTTTAYQELLINKLAETGLDVTSLKEQVISH